MTATKLSYDKIGVLMMPIFLNFCENTQALFNHNLSAELAYTLEILLYT